MRNFAKPAFKAFIPAALFGAAGFVWAPVTAIAGPGISGTAPQSSAPMSPGDLLKPYYENLQVDLPVANTGPALDLSKPLTRIAFGSCNHQGQPQQVWSQIAARQPDLFLAIGDNVYGDFGYAGEADMGSFITAYRQQAAHPEFRDLRSQVPMLASWDDHDFGPNDSGGDFAFKQWSEQIFESFWGASDAARSRPGIYDAIIAGPAGQRAQIIMLDTRFFRSALKRLPYQRPRPPLGSYVATSDPDATLLGEAQWTWLSKQLAKPADLRIIVSSIQILTDAHGYEKWGNMPLERERLYAALKGRSGGDILMLSGDRHSGAIYSDTPPALGETVWELTSSSLNLAFGSGANDEREPDPVRRSSFFADENYGLVDIDWGRKSVTLRLMHSDSRPMATQTVSFAD
ncbi:alkaline phosphatase D [Parasphingorhabdus marina DSM 22363]|uniref:Alkaline phosphatase D n=1 Tax=Parasphingorhabdus marina DSM 22363 TaxID=1123272 RepID=A0A1N6CML8_9SPHN|nr:alkaline phosphatase D family protein [Parasphingorhabdus marina]SIN59820.1 alkaline phosphatase D [Parasphingorhabdus marina DSM 22363]